MIQGYPVNIFPPERKLQERYCTKDDSQKIQPIGDKLKKIIDCQILISERNHYICIFSHY
jgi:hypothetical protein